jgi:hypothetical protein
MAHTLDFSLLPLDGEDYKDVARRAGALAGNLGAISSIDIAKTAVYYYACNLHMGKETALDFIRNPVVSGEFAERALREFDRGFHGMKLSGMSIEVVMQSFAGGVGFRDIPLEIMVHTFFPCENDANRIYDVLSGEQQ